MGVLLSRQEKLYEAKQAYMTAIILDPRGESAANNLERIYRQTGESDKADAMAARIEQNRLRNPYYHYAMGEKQLAMGNPRGAAKHFKNAIRRKDDERLFHYALAETQIALGKYKKASKSLDAAREYSHADDLARYEELNQRLALARSED